MTGTCAEWFIHLLFIFPERPNCFTDRDMCLAKSLIFTVFAYACLAAAGAHAGQVTVASAASFRPALEKIAGAFEKATGNEVVIVTAATGTLAAQVSNGAPFDVFLGADRAHAQKLAVAGLAAAPGPFAYARGRVVLWSRAGPVGKDNVVSLLNSARVRHIVFGQPKLAPYGAAAVDVLRALGIYGKTAKKHVLASNVSQAFVLAASGAADVAFIAASMHKQAMELGGGHFWDVPQTLYRPVVQYGLILKRAGDLQLAKSFTAFLTGPDGSKIVKASGFGLP